MRKIFTPLFFVFDDSLQRLHSTQYGLVHSKKGNTCQFPKPKKNTTSIASINWRQYFADTHLLKLIDTALNNNFDLQTALQRIEISRSRVKLANGALLPHVSFNVGGGVRKFGLYTMDGAGNATTEITPGQIVPVNYPDMYLGLQSSWEVDIWGKLRNQRKSAVSQYLSSIEGIGQFDSQLVYFLVCLFQSQQDWPYRSLLVTSGTGCSGVCELC